MFDAFWLGHVEKLLERRQEIKAAIVLSSSRKALLSVTPVVIGISTPDIGELHHILGVA